MRSDANGLADLGEPLDLAGVGATTREVDGQATVAASEKGQLREGVAEILVDCQNPRCREIQRLRPVSADGPVEGSISGISIAGDPDDEYQAIFHDLVRSLVTDLAERFAGRRS